MKSSLNPQAVSTESLLAGITDLTAGDANAIYSTEGLSLLAVLYTKVAAERRLMYEPTWLGRPIIQLPPDIVALQEVIWRTKPDVIVETGVAHGGSLVLAASILELVGGTGKVIGVDVEIRAHNREAIEKHRLAGRIELVEGDSIADTTLAEVRSRIPAGSRVMVALDSNHTEAHVAAELDAYGDLVTPECYLVAHDGAQLWVWDIPRAAPHWATDHPLTAISNFLAGHDEFTVDEQCTVHGITSSPSGYLLRLAKG